MIKFICIYFLKIWVNLEFVVELDKFDRVVYIPHQDSFV